MAVTEPADRVAVRTRRMRTGRTLVRIGLTGAVLGVLSVVLGLVLVDGGFRSLADSLELTDDGLDAVAETIDVSSEVVTSVGAGTEEVRGAVDDLSGALDSTSTVLEEADELLGGSIPDGIDSIRAPLPGLVLGIDRVTAALSGIPFVGDALPVDPELGAGLAAIDRELETLAARLRDPETRLTTVAGHFAALQVHLTVIDVRLGEVVDTLARAEDLLESYDATSSSAAVLVGDTISDLDRQRVVARILVVVMGGIVVLGMSALVLVGRQMSTDPAEWERV